MASRKKKFKKNVRIPMVDFLLDMTQIATLNYIANKRREKRGGRRGNRIDPYEATGMAMGLGMIKDTEDLIKFGGVLGAMGAFDPDNELYIDTASYFKPRDNRYAWRLNCVDGSAYGVSPFDYETRDAYNAAISRVKQTMDDSPESKTSEMTFVETPMKEKEQEQTQQAETYIANCNDPFSDDDFHVYTYCRVKLADSGEIAYYRTEDQTVKKGEVVVVPSPDAKKNTQGKILSIERHMRFSVPKPVEETSEIISRIT